MAEVLGVCAAVHQHAREHKGLDKEGMKHVGSVEVIRLAGVGHLEEFSLASSFNALRMVSALQCAGWGKAKDGHEVGADILHAKTSTEVYAHERTDYLLIAERLAPQSRREIYRLGQKRVKMFHDWKNPIERSELF